MFSLTRKHIFQALWFGLAVAHHGQDHGSNKHHILVGNFGTVYNVTAMLDGTQDVGKGFLYTLVVDADAKSLTLTHTTPAAAAHPWLSVNRNANVVYGSGWSPPVNGQRTFSSYKVEPDFSVSLINTVTSCGTKPIANDFIAEAGEHGVFYGLDFVTPCGEVWTVDKHGAIETKIQALEFANGSTLHGFATTPDLKYMYLTNLGLNTIHSYALNLANGSVTALGNFTPSELGAGPRHAAITANGAYLYLIDEEGLRVDQFTIDAVGGALHYTNTSLAVTPFGLTPANASLYWGDEIVISSDGRTLYASTRSRDTDFPGYISAWSLATDGSLADTLFTVPTPEAGGTSNILSVSPWQDKSKEMLILTDQDTDFVALYELQGKELKLLDRVK
ncbi:3-carboxy-cis,cis-mucoante lactonizing enzyme [Mycena venus]|uniref:3-carboxy-cis,cis-mucoante lactonizing enzyme n=1 Tax=Mycena venus TaxID=2733690 RepID=A0A8H7DE92_9AGAR|nr:3-carboxy-cis,cis-mucoante lactonizing enzyme [Mycena venus]